MWEIGSYLINIDFDLKTLNLSPSFKFIAGATNVEDYQITPLPGTRFQRDRKFAGRAISDNIIDTGFNPASGYPIRLLRPQDW